MKVTPARAMAQGCVCTSANMKKALQFHCAPLQRQQNARHVEI